jgi:hypothetical protein
MTPQRTVAGCQRRIGRRTRRQGWKRNELGNRGGGLQNCTSISFRPHRISFLLLRPRAVSPFAFQSANLLGAAPDLSEVRTRVPPIRGPRFFRSDLFYSFFLESYSCVTCDCTVGSGGLGPVGGAETPAFSPRFS